jgi:hypothetical protein
LYYEIDNFVLLLLSADITQSSQRGKPHRCMHSRRLAERDADQLPQCVVPLRTTLTAIPQAVK